MRLISDSGTILDTVISKEILRDSLDHEFYDKGGLYLLDYSSVRSNRLFLEAFIGVDETDWLQVFELGIFYQGPQKGKIWLRKEPLEFE